MGSNVTKMQGFQARGGDTPAFNPCEVGIVGLSSKDPDYIDGVDVPATDENWFAHCPRVNEEIEDEFVEDIALNGVQRFIDVYRDGDRLRTLEGRRRLRSARRAWKIEVEDGKPEDERTSVRVIIRSGTPEQLFKYNVGSDGPELRKNRNPIQRAELMSIYFRKVNEDIAKTAKMFTCSVAQARNYLRLLDLAASVQGDVAKGTLSMSNALRIADLPRADQVTVVAEYKTAMKESAPSADNVAGGENDHDETSSSQPAKKTSASKGGEKGEKGEKPKKAAPRKRIAIPDTIRSRREVLSFREMAKELEVPKELRELQAYFDAFCAWVSNNRIGNSDVTKLIQLVEKHAEKPKEKRA